MEKYCRVCRMPAAEKFCQHCGEQVAVKKITASSILHEVFHYFTHLDKGFPYTLKQLIRKPGTMQKEYVEGMRSKHQKPFSMFFICITITALGLYWINYMLVKYFGKDNSDELFFFQQYMVWLQFLLLPFYSLAMFLLFRKSGYNYGEIVVLMLYTFSVLFIILVMIHLLKFIVPDLETRYLELPAALVYSLVTNFRFFKLQPRWKVALKTVVACGVIFLLAALTQDNLIKFLLHK